MTQQTHELSRKNKITVTQNMLKLFAVVAMTLDHIAVMFIPSGTALYIIFRTFGRITAPLMCYFVSQGFKYTKNRKRYFMRLFIFSLISHFPYALYMEKAFHFESLFKITSIIWGLTMGYVALWVCSNKKTILPLKILAVALCCVLAYPSDYNLYPVILILFFGLLRTNLFAQLFSYTVITLGVYILPIVLKNHVFHLYWLGYLLFIPLILIYSGKRGAKNAFTKWSFYVYYPLHLLIIWLVAMYLR